MASNTRPNRNSTPPRRSFGVVNSPLDGSTTSPGPALANEPPGRRFLGRLSSSYSQRRASATRTDEEAAVKSSMERPPIPNALQAGEPYSTPLPVLSMIVLSIAMLGEFLSANVSTPFMLFMVKGFGEFHDEADIAFWTGILVATFFLTQFLTSLLWATVADKHGQRSVLVVSLLGSAVTCAMFGTSTTLRQAIAIRLLQGIFAGAVGVARGCVTVVTDTTNEGRAYAIMGFCWGFGGVAGAIIGGSLESPAEKWPDIFRGVPLLVKFPYLLPCLIASSITLFGSVLACFLGRDGGPREGAIRLPHEKPDEQHPTIPEEDVLSPALVAEDQDKSFVGSLRKKVSQRFSGYFASRVYDAHGVPVPSPSRGQAVPLSSPRPDRQRAFSRTSRANGSAYGYSGSYRNRLASTASVATRRGSLASTLRRRRGSAFDGPRSFTDAGDLNFAQRLLMANENAVTNIADLWVAAAMNVDNEDPFESDNEMDSDIDSIYSREGQQEDDGDDDDEDDNGVVPNSILSTPSRPSRSVTQNLGSPPARSQRASSITFAPDHISPRHPSSSRPRLSIPSGNFGSPSPAAMEIHPRRPSSTVPAIFAHSGVRTPSAVLDAQSRIEEPSTDALTPILERRRSSILPQSTPEQPTEEKPPSLTSQLPILIIIQYALLALHSTTHDQVFLSYLVSDYESGGLNLNAGHFAQLIALMCLAQIIYQFYLYPNIGPPRGRFSHLSMFRLGSLLFIPAYLTVILYRVFASPTDDGNFILMTALALSTAVRYCGNTFGYTSVAILLNYMTPPHAVGFANGIAQSIVSFARCLGPVLGGYLWSVSTQDNPSGYPLGFLVCAGVCALAVAQSFFIR
ncbi:hypothetical protein SERLA73DRAFT_102048 [Serpula lacrymans var. lacrymans S7.3]|uniref:Major facilitator superfamily (MFS) profile domain-containing protein n=2 Tax=Serpula lacrymans var. lacrymans TaxID=341189 RepID=F8PJE2_SERL3|nr:uncharacterized protein SERLADRAFT_445413 [Serpula lacrymans var. lacrymans S7.9]EGO03767.1 hypothetical protein SERLA73DRAFT_102048 [Serpula lacrymans var. lacrymans S7.3]EGO29631.1 hypothetical protein SERLADRAFT_445413 [Serpula lacrymans var. lacrymans S7.9]